MIRQKPFPNRVKQDLLLANLLVSLLLQLPENKEQLPENREQLLENKEQRLVLRLHNKRVKKNQPKGNLRKVLLTRNQLNKKALKLLNKVKVRNLKPKKLLQRNNEQIKF